MRKVMLIVGVLVAWQAQADHVITLGARKIEGLKIRGKANGTMILTTVQGTSTFPKGSYLKAVADRPKELDEAIELIKAQQYDRVEPILEYIARDYSSLVWDRHAAHLLTKLYLKLGKPKKAFSFIDAFYQNCSDCKEDHELRWLYIDVLFHAERFDVLHEQLTTIIKSGNRADVARAQMMRGDRKVATDDLKGAVLDYLRTALLFESEREYQPAALFKTAEVLTQLSDPRAEEFYERVAEEYPSSAYAKKAKEQYDSNDE